MLTRVLAKFRPPHSAVLAKIEALDAKLIAMEKSLGIEEEESERRLQKRDD